MAPPSPRFVAVTRSCLSSDDATPGVSSSDSNSSDSNTRPLRRNHANKTRAAHFRDPLAETKKICIGIGGGVGPAAGVMLHKKIIEATISGGSDQGHCEVHHISRPGVADRTSYLLGESQDNPAGGMALTMEAVASSARKSGKTHVVAGVPCNTFHAPPIWDEFIRTLETQRISRTVHMVHMLHETACAIEKIVPGAKKIGLLSTTGTRDSRVYANLLEPMGYEVVQVDLMLQSNVHDAIYNKEWGVKAVQPTTYQACGAFANFARDLVVQGAEAIILGCTEIPLALPEPHFSGVPLIDPMAVLARACIRKAGALATEIDRPKVELASSAPPPMMMCLSYDTKMMAPAAAVPVREKKIIAPVWQQHAAAFVIQSHWRAHLSVKRTGSGGLLCPTSHEDFFRNAYCGSPTPGLCLDQGQGLTPEVFTPTSGIAAAMLRVCSTDDTDMLMT
eukprot:TRINITY_DN3654_c0_g1_i8.p1 TRINITY_DN3654_c0_g1~~TRINITY_DN3654_c0_g1_i8.p1  ORF type:complete len:488 (+),score=143.29 TRINITY_DN3654_c0_g1_i8:120-1466(+)